LLATWLDTWYVSMTTKFGEDILNHSLVITIWRFSVRQFWTWTLGWPWPH